MQIKRSENKEYILSLFEYLRTKCAHHTLLDLFVECSVVQQQVTSVDDIKIGKFVEMYNKNTLERNKSPIIKYYIYSRNSKTTVTFTKEEYMKDILPIIRLRLNIRE